MTHNRTIGAYLNKRSWWAILKPIYFLIAVIACLVIAYMQTSYTTGTVNLDYTSGRTVFPEQRSVSLEKEGLSGEIETQTEFEGFWFKFLLYISVFLVAYFVFRRLVLKIYLKNQASKIGERRKRLTPVRTKQDYDDRLNFILEILDTASEKWTVLSDELIKVAQEELNSLMNVQKNLKEKGETCHTFYEVKALIHYYRNQYEQALETLHEAIKAKGHKYEEAQQLETKIKEHL